MKKKLTEILETLTTTPTLVYENRPIASTGQELLYIFGSPRIRNSHGASSPRFEKLFRAAFSRALR